MFKSVINYLSIAASVALLVLIGHRSAESSNVQTQTERTGIDVRTSVADQSYQLLKERPVMVSVIRDGAVLKQSEVRFNSNARFMVPSGLYDVRIEGDGMQTLVKRGIHVTEGDMTQIVGGPIAAGTGVKVVEYATGGLSREEIAARLAKLEAAVAELRSHQTK
jgi:hypothetical protein